MRCLSRALLRFAIAGGLVSLLTACASMSPEECHTANWREQGAQDGRNGQPRSQLERHREACGKVGVVPDARAYEAGRILGIRQYCTPENGLAQGRRGSSYRNVCPPEIEAAFLDRYRAGYRVYEAQRRVDKLTSDQRSLQYSLDRAKDDKARRSYRSQLRDLDYSLRRARDDLYYEEQRLYR